MGHYRPVEEPCHGAAFAGVDVLLEGDDTYAAPGQICLKTHALLRVPGDVIQNGDGLGRWESAHKFLPSRPRHGTAAGHVYDAQAREGIELGEQAALNFTHIPFRRSQAAVGLEGGVHRLADIFVRRVNPQALLHHSTYGKLVPSLQLGWDRCVPGIARRLSVPSERWPFFSFFLSLRRLGLDLLEPAVFCLHDGLAGG